MYKYKDFSALAFNPMCEGKMLLTYPALEVIGGDDKVLRYIVMIYSKDSPLVRLETNVNHRKTVAAKLAGFDEFMDEEVLLPIYDCSNDVFLNQVTTYIKTFQLNRLWVKIITNEQLFDEYTSRCMEPIKRSELGKEKDEMQSVLIKAKLREELNAIDDDLTAFYQKLYDVDDQLEKAVKKKRASPENPI